MSYDLTFWKQKPACVARPSTIYQQLLDRADVQDLETIPTIEFIARIERRFPGIVRDGSLVYWEGGERGMFEVYSSDQHLRFCCREMSAEEMSAIIEVADELEIPFYDPQDDVRYDAASGGKRRAAGPRGFQISLTALMRATLFAALCFGSWAALSRWERILPRGADTALVITMFGAGAQSFRRSSTKRHWESLRVCSYCWCCFSCVHSECARRAVCGRGEETFVGRISNGEMS